MAVVGVLAEAHVGDDDRIRRRLLDRADRAGDEAVRVEVLAAAGVDAHEIDYVESHGTGTALGEANVALATVPMDLIEAIFGRLATGLATVLPEGSVRELVTQGIVGGDMAWPLIIAGILMGIAMIMIGVKSPMLVAIGMYLPLGTTFAIFVVTNLAVDLLYGWLDPRIRL